MDPYATSTLARTLSAGQQAAVAAFYKPSLSAILVLGVFLPLLFGMMAGIGVGIAGIGVGILTELRDIEAIVPIGLGIGGVALVLAQLLLRWSSRRKMARAAFIYQYGQPETVTFAGLTSENYGKNNRPKTVINLLRGSEPLKIKTFDDRIIAAFMLPQQVVYTHTKYPDVLIPGSLFAPGWATGPGAKPRVVEV